MAACLLTSCLLDTHSLQAVFRRTQFKALVSIHSQAEGLGGNLSSDEISVIQGALDLGSKPASACMTPLDKVMGLSMRSQCLHLVRLRCKEEVLVGAQKRKARGLQGKLACPASRAKQAEIAILGAYVPV